MGYFHKYDQPCRYDIQVRGSIDPKWVDWFGGLTILSLGEAETLLTGLIADQASLHGLLGVIRNLGLTLLSLQRAEIPKSHMEPYSKRNRSSQNKTPSKE